MQDFLPLPTNSQLSPLVVNTASLGLSYYSLKLYASMHTAHRSGTRQPTAIAATVLFFPSFAIGPIDEASAFGESVVSRSFSSEAAIRGVARIGTGVAKAYVIAPYIAEDLGRRFVGQDLTTLSGWGGLSTTEAIAATYLAFLRLFFDFSGFTSIAVGTGLLFNITVSENFKAPFLANSIQNFWQRWHLSLSTFITKYLFQPMVRATGKPVLSMVTAFVLIGLWHEPTLGYLIWGVGHGAALGWYFRRSRGRRREPNCAVPATPHLDLDRSHNQLRGVHVCGGQPQRLVGHHRLHQGARTIRAAMTQHEQPMTDQSAEVPVAHRALGRLIAIGSNPKVRLIALLVAGIAAWILVIANFPLEDAIPRYADF